ncbi:LysR family transcriptional regulator [Shewanella nanhaiensis]|uniref:LysR family transcriptional regulator n=1 Tax=Shewanella nanhaiensis TaxID=2864872 RepID=A0ABS7E1E7_9GAMM|nr:LysR family transcriptional regulator [Shewanella nanhaiensis]MBW8183515.1 LysR family transcriptional regulator [Shewanella nanhaiensis]
MGETDYLVLDGRLLRLFLTVFDTGSVSGAADKLDLNQSTVSNGLERLRRIIGEPLFVRSGRGIIPTQEASRLAPLARELLAKFEQFVEAQEYRAADESRPFVIAANDYERDILLPQLLVKLRKLAPNAPLKVLTAGAKETVLEQLRQGEIDLVLSPGIEANVDDLKQQWLFSDCDAVFYDPEVIKGPIDLAQYVALPHARVVFNYSGRSEIDEVLTGLKLEREIKLEVANFSALSSMMRGSELVTTLPSRVGISLLDKMAQQTPPIPLNDINIYQFWHQAYTHSPRHRWLRELVKVLAEELPMLN